MLGIRKRGFSYMQSAKAPLLRALPNGRAALSALTLPLCGLLVASVVNTALQRLAIIDDGLELFSVVVIIFLYLARPAAPLQVLTLPAPAPIGWSLLGFGFSMIGGLSWANYGLCIGVIAGIFTRIDPVRFWKALRADSRVGIALVLGILSGPFVVVSQKYFWMYFAKTTATAMSFALLPFFKTTDVATKNQLIRANQIFGEINKALSDLGITLTHKMTNFVMVVTENNTFMKIVSTMNVGNGLCMMIFLVGVMAACFPASVRAVRLVWIYGFSLIFVWVGNVVWLCLLYLLLPPINNVSPDPISAEVKIWMAITTNATYSWIGYAILGTAALCIMRFMLFKPALEMLASSPQNPSVEKP